MKSIKNFFAKEKVLASLKNIFIPALIVLIVSELFFVFSPIVVFDESNPLGYVLIMIGASLIFGATMFWTFKLCFYINAFYKKRVLDVGLIILIIVYLFVSLLIAAFIIKQENSCKAYQDVVSINQLTWTLFGVSMPFFAVIVGLPSYIKRKETNTLNELALDILDTLYPILLSLLTGIVGTIMLYFFYDKYSYHIELLCTASFVSTIVSIPYYLLAGLYLLYKVNKK